MSSLRALLGTGAVEVPPFDLRLPPGWIVVDWDEDEAQRLGDRLRLSGDDDATGWWTPAARALTDAGVFAIARPGPDAPDWAVQPAVLTAAVRSRGVPERRRVEEDVATPIAGGVSAVVVTLAMPDGGAALLELTASVTHAGDAASREGAAAWLELMDACFDTFAWLERSVGEVDGGVLPIDGSAGRSIGCDSLPATAAGDQGSGGSNG